MIVCPRCHRENRNGAKFCDECGLQLPASPLENEPLASEGSADVSVAENGGFGAAPDRVSEEIDAVVSDEFFHDEDIDEATGAIASRAAVSLLAHPAAAADLPECENELGDEPAGEPADNPAGELSGYDETSPVEGELSDSQQAKPASDDEADTPNEPLSLSDSRDPGKTELLSPAAVAVLASASPLPAIVGASADGVPAASNPAASAHVKVDKPDLDAKTRSLGVGLEGLTPLQAITRELDRDKTVELPGVKPSPADGYAQPSVDLSGFDEYLVDSGYVPPQSAWRSGDTMKMPRIESQPVPEQRDYRAPDPSAHKLGVGKKAAIALLVLVLAGAGVAGATYYLEMWGGKTVPNVVGMTQSDASFSLQNKGFGVSTSLVKSDDTEGLVLSTDPASGTRVEGGSLIALQVSQARTVTDVVGQGKDAAFASLAADGFSNVQVVEQRVAGADGTVSDVQPAAGSRAKADDPITLTVNVPFTVPDVSGMSYSDAVAAVNEAGYTASRTYVYDDTGEDGSVVGSKPSAGEEAPKGSTVILNVVKSREADLVAKTTSYLKSAGSVSIGGVSYPIRSVDGASYLGDGKTAFTISTYVSGSVVQKSGTITWDSNNYISSIQ